MRGRYVTERVFSAAQPLHRLQAAQELDSLLFSARHQVRHLFFAPRHHLRHSSAVSGGDMKVFETQECGISL
jgi:hypothetical protein